MEFANRIFPFLFNYYFTSSIFPFFPVESFSYLDQVKRIESVNIKGIYTPHTNCVNHTHFKLSTINARVLLLSLLCVSVFFCSCYNVCKNGLSLSEHHHVVIKVTRLYLSVSRMCLYVLKCDVFLLQIFICFFAQIQLHRNYIISYVL